MDLLSLLRLIGRHWRVTVPAALLTLVGLVGALQLSSPTYQATGSIVLLSPPQAPEIDAATEDGAPPEAGQNPFARYGDLSVVADILARVMDGDAKRAEFESQGVTGYEVVANRFQRGPVVEVTGKDSRSEGAIASAETVLEDVNAVLAKLQQVEHADPDYYITSAPLDPPSTATAMYGSTIRTAIAVMALGALFTLGLTVLAEAIRRRRPVRAAPAGGGVVSDQADLDAERGAPNNGSHGEAWPGIPSAPRFAGSEPPAEEPDLRKIPWDGRSMPQLGGQKTAPNVSSEFPAGNGHKQPTTDPRP